MTLNLLFLSITFSKRNYTQEEIKREVAIQKITEEIRDRKCSLRNLI
ncbi:YrzI family small protein [Bacillus sp. DJP31]